jgi:hypothetical protein
MKIKTLRSAILVLLVALVPSGAHAGPNKILNPGFETSVLPEPVRQAAFSNGLKNGLYAPDWRFEGVTALFDQTGQDPHTGNMAGAISGSLSGPRNECSVQCVDVPGSDVRDQVYDRFSVAPAFVSAVPFAVTSGAAYTFSFYVRTSILRDLTGAVTRVRWYDANHLPISTTRGPSLIAPKDGATYLAFANGDSTQFNAHSYGWRLLSKALTAPSTAKFAEVVLGYSDDAWIGQVVYDDVFFG